MTVENSRQLSLAAKSPRDQITCLDVTLGECGQWRLVPYAELDELVTGLDMI